MPKNFHKIAAITICLIFIGCTYCCGDVNGTTSGVRTILRGILFECSNDYHQQQRKGEKCEPYLAISIKTDPSLYINKLHQFLTLDQIYVANRFATAKLVAPYVIEIIRGEPLMLCPVQHDNSLTAKDPENEFETVNGNRFMNGEQEENSKSEFNSMSDIAEENCNNGKRDCANVSRYFAFNTNLPIPFLATTVKIFQKRYSTWWKLAPPVTVDSYAAYYANGLLSVWLKYHVNIFQLTKSRNRLKNFKLLMRARNNSAKLDNLMEPEQFLPENEYESKNFAQNSHIKAKIFFENCAYNSSILCINMLDDIVAGYSIKLRLPFIENAFVKPNVFKVKIINAITDATVKDTVQVSLTLVNEDFEVHEFAINVDCLEHQTCNTQKLVPHIGETVNFFLPFIFKAGSHESKKAYCKIQIKTLAKAAMKRNLYRQKVAQMDTHSSKNQRTITTRKITVIPHQRCLCVWKCNCHCLNKLETNVDFNVCQELDSSSQSKAGLLVNSNYYELHENDSEDSVYHIQNFLFDCFRLAILTFLFMGFLGFCKAILGICLTSVDEWGYDYLQPGRKYVDSSKCRHFLINLFYFVFLPFLMCCNCFTPSVEDLLISNSENFMTKMYIYVYEVFYDHDPTLIIIEETSTSLQTDEY